MTRRIFLGFGTGALASGVVGCAAGAPARRSAGPAMQCIGVLGGLGPQATMDFEQRLHRAAQQRIPPHLNSGYPPMVVHYCRHAPFVVDESGAPIPPLRPEPRLLAAARQLGALADFLVVPSNGAHLLRDAIEAAAGRRMLSIVDVTLAEVARRGWRRVGVIGLGEPVVYTVPLAERGLACETLVAPARARLDDTIFRTMEGRELTAGAAAARAAVAELRGRGVDGVILGCTELPVLLGADADAPDLVNTTEVLAEAALAESLG